MKRFAALKTRIERRRGRPLIYVGAATSGNRDGGYHAHLLLWSYQHVAALRGDARELGLGTIKIEQIRPDDQRFHVLSVATHERSL